MSAPVIHQAELPFSLEDKVQMLEDDNRHLKEENADLKEQLARVLRLQFGSKSERIEVGELAIEAEEAPEPPATTPKARPDSNPEPKRKCRMKVHYRKVVEETRFPEEVMADPAAYVRLPESCDVIVERVESRPACLVLHRIRCLKGDVTKGTMWAMNCTEDNMCLYYWRTSRGKSVLDTLLREDMKEDGAVYGGAIVTDGYEAYASWLKDLPETARPAWQSCWAHVRRKFVEGARNSNDPDWCRKVVELIRPLYQIERELRESKAPPEEIAARRGGESREVVTAFFRTLEERAKDTSNPPVNNLRKAIDYALSRRERLGVPEHPD